MSEQAGPRSLPKVAVLVAFVAAFLVYAGAIAGAFLPADEGLALEHPLLAGSRVLPPGTHYRPVPSASSSDTLKLVSPIKHTDLMPVDVYLAGELTSEIKHEYVGGVVYAMAGARNSHNIVATSVLGLLYGQLVGRTCQPFNSDTKIRINLPTHVRFYYPDVSVVCRPNPQSDSFQESPAAIFEVTSPDTRRTDEGEKRDTYMTISSLFAYVLLEQDAMSVVVYRRTENGFVREVLEGPDAVIAVPEIPISLRLGDIYRNVELKPRT